MPADARNAQVWTGEAISASKAAADTFYILGGPARQDGKFQDNTGTLPDAEGWYGVDLTILTVPNWNIDTFNAELLDLAYTPNHAMYCGAIFEPCSVNDPPQGYGTNWNEWLDWYGTVGDNTQPTNVTVTARLNHDTEVDYDYLYFEVERATGMDQLRTWTNANVDTNGVFVPEDVSVIFTVGTEDYVGDSLNQVHLRWHVSSDSGASDQDCGWPGYGAAQVDNITVKFGTVTQAFDDFEPESPVNWVVVFPPASGDFHKVWPRLADIDPCNANNSPLMAFIDDGIVVPGTGGTYGTTYTYGPSGFIHNLTGGLAGPEFHMNNEVWSPILNWPAGAYDGALFNFDVYRHLPLANGMFYVWHIQSSDDGGATWSGWADRNLVYYSNTSDWLRINQVVTDLLLPGRNLVQLALGANEYGWNWGFNGTDGTPSPYFDNVQLVAFGFGGPGIATRDIDTFNDDFPAIGVIDYGVLGDNSVRVDMARSISNPLHLRNDPGDSMIIDVAAVRTGSVLEDRPEMHVRMKLNPLFDDYRTLPAGFTRTGDIADGVVLGDTTYVKPSFTVVDNRWNWDLPDTGFFYPGDVFHYFIKAQDNQDGDIGTTFLPGDTAGFSTFPGHPDYRPLLYPSMYIVRALPTLFSATPTDQPRILFWNDFADRGGENEWVGSLSQLGYVEGSDYDIYYTNGPSSGVGNGLGGRASALQLSGYRTMLYTSGDLGSYTISNGDFNQDAGDDVGVMNGWLGSGGKNLFATGDDLEYDLNRSGSLTIAFRNTWLGVTHVANDVRPLITNQAAPKVRPIAANAVGLTDEYIAFGGCQVFNDFDAVTASGTGTRIAEYTSPTGASGAYTYSAAVYNNVTTATAEVVYMPYDLMFIYDIVAKAPAGLPVRAKVLQKILLFFGEAGSDVTVDVPSAGVFSAKNYPNPFNPLTKIEFSLPRTGQVELKIYNVRGELVRTLVNETRVAAPSYVEEWDGRDDGGRSVASGVYFYSLKAAGYEKVAKMTMVK